jgi:hypothetical protein
MPDPITKQQLIAALTKTRDEALVTLRAIPAAAFDEGRYENGWNGREILAHVASIEWTYPRLLDLARAASVGDAGPAARGAQPSPPVVAEPPAQQHTADSKQQNVTSAPVRRTADDGSPTNAPAANILSYNDRQVAKRAGVPVADLIAEFETNRNALIAAVGAADEELLSRTIRSAGGITGPVSDVIAAVADGHVRMHVADVAGERWDGVRF